MESLFFKSCNKMRIFSVLFAFLMVTISVGEINAQITISNTFGTSPLPQPTKIIATSSGTQNGRLFRSGTETTCVSNPPASDWNVGITLKFEAYSFYAATDGCLNVNVTTLNSNLYFSLYSGSYDPANYTTNCIGQQGSSGLVNFGSTVVANQLYTLVVSEVNPGSTDTYTIDIDNGGDGIPVPVSPWWIILFFILMGTFVVYKHIKKINFIATSKK